MTHYKQQLVGIRKALASQFSSFPTGCCSIATKVAGKHLGLEERAGFFRGTYWHAWNYDPKLNIYVDITSDQFKGFSEILLTPAPSKLYQHDSSILADHHILDESERQFINTIVKSLEVSQ